MFFLYVYMMIFFASRRSTSVDDPASENSSVSGSVEEKLTKEEWEAVNKLLSFQPDEDLVQTGKDVRNMIHYMIIVSISKAAARIVNIDNTEIVCGRFENLNVCTKLKQKSIHCDVTLQYYGFSSPEGTLVQVCFLNIIFIVEFLMSLPLFLLGTMVGYSILFVINLAYWNRVSPVSRR